VSSALHGEVEWNYQRTAAESAVRMHTGVPGLTNAPGVVTVVNELRIA
jgi:hypothetical protein